MLVVVLSLLAATNLGAQADAPVRLDRGRFTVVCYPSENTLARSLLDFAVRTDTFPGLPRPQDRVLIAIAPDHQRFRDWSGAGAPEWGSAISFPESHRIVMQGSRAGSDAGDPRETLRHELAHLALHEYLDDLPTRWFDEGYASFAAREWSRNDVLATNFALALRGTPSFDELETEFQGPTNAVQSAYALAYQAVFDLDALSGPRGFALFLANWKRTGRMDSAMRATFGITLGEFEHRWQKNTRRRYGGLALFGDLALAGLVLLVIILPLYLLRRQRDRRRMAALRAADEAADRVARQSALEALLGETGPPGDAGPDEPVDRGS